MKSLKQEVDQFAVSWLNLRTAYDSNEVNGEWGEESTRGELQLHRKLNRVERREALHRHLSESDVSVEMWWQVNSSFSKWTSLFITVCANFFREKYKSWIFVADFSVFDTNLMYLSLSGETKICFISPLGVKVCLQIFKEFSKNEPSNIFLIDNNKHFCLAIVLSRAIGDPSVSPGPYPVASYSSAFTPPSPYRSTQSSSMTPAVPPQVNKNFSLLKFQKLKFLKTLKISE